MSSFQESFAKTLNSSIDDEWTPAPVKNFKPKKQQPLKAAVFSAKPNLALIDNSKPIINDCEKNCSATSSLEVQNSQSMCSLSGLQSSDKSCLSGLQPSGPAKQTFSEGTRKPRGPPKGINVILDKEWKDWVRALVPNKGANKPDRLVMDEISKLKSKPDVTLYKFKQIVCMIFHQALKSNRNTLIQQIIKRWKDSKFDIIELIDSTCDRCKPIFQACWSGSLDCIQLIVASDQTDQILESVHPSKPDETILMTLTMGMNKAITDNPSNVEIFNRRYTECIEYIQTAIRRMEANKVTDETDIAINIPFDIRDEIENLKLSEGVVEQLCIKIVDLFLSDQSLATNYFNAVKTLVQTDVFNQIDQRLKDEGIVL